MRSARLLAVWLAASWVALTVLWRMSRGEVVLLSNYAAPVVRLVALVLVFVASCADRLRPGESQGQGEDLAPGPGASGGADGGGAEVPQGTGPVVTVEPVTPVPAAFPEALTDESLAATYEWIEPRGTWQRVLRAQAGSPAKDVFGRLLADPALHAGAQRLIAAVDGFVARQDRGEPETAATLRELLAAAEAVPLFDAWLAGFVWVQARKLSPAPVDVFAAVERHMRVAHALVLAQATTGRVEFSAWRSKAGPPPDWKRVHVPAGLAKAARREFEGGADAGLFESAAVLTLKVELESVVLVRRGSASNVGIGEAVRLRRLDVIRAANGGALRHATLGVLALPKGAELTAWNAVEFLSAEGRARVQALVDAAMGGDAGALTELEEVLPAAHGAIRAATLARPEAAGAAGLRTLLTAFDE